MIPLHLNPRNISSPRASDGRWYSDGRVSVGASGLTFAPAEGISLTGTVTEGEDLLLEDSQARFGDKLTQNPYIYDLLDRGVWEDGVRKEYSTIADDSEVPEIDGFYEGVFNTKFKPTPIPLAGREFVYGGDMVLDAESSNLTLRKPNIEQSLPDTVEPPRPNYFASARWMVNFDSSQLSGSDKIWRIWGLKDSSSFGRFRYSLNNGWDGSGAMGETEDITVNSGDGYGGISSTKWDKMEVDFRYTEEPGFHKARKNGIKFRDVVINTIGAGPDGPWGGGVWNRQWGFDPSGGEFNEGDMGYFADLYTDASPARVVLTESATDPFVDNGAVTVEQMHTSWSSGSIQLRDLYSADLGGLLDKHLWLLREDRSSLYLGQISEQ